MFRTGPVTPLTADSLRQLLRKPLHRKVAVSPGRDLGIGVVTKKAGAGHAPPDALMGRTLEAARHEPVADPGVPGQKQHERFAMLRPVQIAAGTIAGTENPVDADRQAIDALSAGIFLVPDEGQPAVVAAVDAVETLRGFVNMPPTERFDDVGSFRRSQ